MKTYKFFQQYNWGPGWNGEIELPNSAIFYNINPNKKFQEWYVLIPVNDFNHNTIDKGVGCIQVQYYQLMDYIIVHLNNITADNWPDVGKESFDSLFDKLFSNIYVYKYKKALYHVNINNDATELSNIVHTELASPETLLTCYRSKSLCSDAEIQCTRVNLKGRYDLNDDYFIDTCELRLCDIQPDQIDIFEKHIKYVVSKDPTSYEKSWDTVIKKLL